MRRKAGNNGDSRIKELLGGRGLALIILVVATTVCFALGFFVGKTTAPEKIVVKKEQVRVEVPADCPEPANSARPDSVGVMTPASSTSSASSDNEPQRVPEVLKTLPKPPPPKRIKKAQAPLPEPIPAPVKEPGQAAQSRGPMFAVQVGAFESLTDAEHLSKGYKGKGYDAYVLRDSASGAKAVFKVRVGEFADRDEARLMAVKIKSIEGIGAYIVRSQ